MTKVERVCEEVTTWLYAVSAAAMVSLLGVACFASSTRTPSCVAAVYVVGLEDEATYAEIVNGAAARCGGAALFELRELEAEKRKFRAERARADGGM